LEDGEKRNLWQVGEDKQKRVGETGQQRNREQATTEQRP
jgi:hypothetical protein